jgi:hypothetical protein
MAVDEQARHRFYNRAVEVFGEEEATILMAHLPPGGWSNLATKQDLLQLRQEIKQDLLQLEGRLKSHVLRTVLTANLSMAVAFAGIALAAVGLG